MIKLKSFIPKRTWLRFSLGSVLLAVAVIAYGCKWTLDRVNHYAGQHNRLAIMSMNPEQFRWLHPPVASGSGTYGGHFVWSFAEPTGWEKAMADWMGIKYEVDVVALVIFQRTVDLARDMETALGMPHLKELAFNNVTIDDDIISACKRMKRLERLTFVKIDISDETASALKRALPNTSIVVWRSHPTKDMIKAVVLPCCGRVRFARPMSGVPIRYNRPHGREATPPPIPFWADSSFRADRRRQRSGLLLESVP